MSATRASQFAAACVCCSWYWRPTTSLAAIGTVIAALAFATTAYAAGQYWLALLRGTVEMPGYATHPAPGPPYFTVVAMIGTSVSLVLVGSWLRPEDLS
jgi:hypothetical protein